MRRPPRGVPKQDFAKRDFYDVWLPNLAPSEPLIKRALRADDARTWASFKRAFVKEMKAPEASRVLDLLAALSHTANLSVGCYCEREERCHRSILRELLGEHGARLA